MSAADTLRQLAQDADERVMAGWFAAISVNSSTVRLQLKRAGHTTMGPHDRAGAARHVIAQCAHRATALGGMAGLGGFASVPPEAAAQLIAVVRLGQRIGVIYGFEPHTDRGKLALWQALAAAYDIDLPHRGSVGLRLTDLPAVVAPWMLTSRTISAGLLRGALLKNTLSMGARFSRALPVFSAAAAAAQGRRRVGALGTKMLATFTRLSDFTPGLAVDDALELPAGKHGT